MDKNEQEKEKIVQSFSKKVTPEVALLGQYVPVTKTKKFDLKGADKLQSNPFQKKETPKFCIYDGDYLGIDKNDNSEKKQKVVWRILKNILTNMPVISFFLLKIKQLKLREFLTTLEAVNANTDRAAEFFEGKTVLNEEKYRKICAELRNAQELGKFSKDIIG